MNNILIAVCGLTPQVVTETIWCLYKRKKILIDELYLITTEEGYKHLITGPKCLQDNKVISKNISIKDALKEMYSSWKRPLLKFELNENFVILAQNKDVNLIDAKDQFENEIIPSVIYNVIKDKTSNQNNILYCSLSGGRKTMSSAMSLAISLFGRESDKLLHVVADKKFEKLCKFYPGNKEEDSLLFLSEIPFVKLRGLLKIEEQSNILNKGYSELVHIAQQELSKLLSNDTLILHPDYAKITLSSYEINIDKQYILNYIFILKSVLNKTSVTRKYVTSKEAFYFYNKIRDEYGVEAEPSYDITNKDKYYKSFRARVSKFNSVLRYGLKDSEDTNFYNLFSISTNGAHGSKNYTINGSSKIKIKY